MILAECGVFAAMCLAGAVSAGVVFCLDGLGRASRAARAVGDLLSAAFCGAAYFLTLYFAASGVFRLYSLAAFFTGLALTWRLLKRAEPRLRALVGRVLSPLVTRYKRLESAWVRRLEPITSRWEERRRVRRLRAETRAAARAEKRRRKGASDHPNEGYVVTVERRKKSGRKRMAKVP